MAKAQPKNPRNTPEATEGTGNTPAAQEQGQDNTAQGTTNAAPADGATAAPQGYDQAAGSTVEQTGGSAPVNGDVVDAVIVGTGTGTSGSGSVDDQVVNDSNTDVVILGAGPAAAASAALAAVAQVLAAAEQAAPAAPEGPARDEQGRLEYEVVSPLNNGKRHEIGARVWLSDEDAGPLLGHTVTPYKPTAATDDEDEGAAHA